MLYVVATPIGNLGDLSQRAVEALRAAGVIACEDTRRTRHLLSHFGVPCPQLVSYREHTEHSAGARLLDLLLQGKIVALCSDGGCPAISDPGYRLVSAAVEAGVQVVVVPGASAVLTALMASGLPTSSFTFKGYPPRKPGPSRRFLEQERDLPHTLILFESPHRVGATLAVAREVLGNRRAAVCVELTKKFERIDRGSLDDLARAYAGKPTKGEVTIVIAGSNPKFLAEPSGAEVTVPDVQDSSDQMPSEEVP